MAQRLSSAAALDLSDIAGAFQLLGPRTTEQMTIGPRLECPDLVPETEIVRCTVERLAKAFDVSVVLIALADLGPFSCTLE